MKERIEDDDGRSYKIWHRVGGGGVIFESLYSI